MPLAEMQALMRDAVILGSRDIEPQLVGGRDPLARLNVHRRHYEASLVEAVLRRFPGLVWLVGEGFMTAAAREFIRWHPPSAPCIAEYAADFPAFIARRAEAEHLPYLLWFAKLEWNVGEVSLATDQSALTPAALQAFATDRLMDVVLTMQQGLRYLEVLWPVDDLINMYMTESGTEGCVLEPDEIQLQIHGSRGAFRIARLDPACFAFRSALQEGRTLGEASERALAIDDSFAAGQGILAVFAEGLITDAALTANGESQ